jgi:ABC-type sugar transport system ATPase subunit
VATFIGAPPMALLDAVLENGHLRVGETRWALPPDLAALPAGRVRLGVRPEGWLLDAPDGAPLAVSHLERLPTERASYVRGTLNGVGLTVLAPLEQPQTSTLRVAPDWEKVYVFEAEGEAPLHTPEMLELF